MQDTVICQTYAKLQCFSLVQFHRRFTFCLLKKNSHGCRWLSDARLTSCLNSLQKSQVKEETDEQKHLKFPKAKTTCQKLYCFKTALDSDIKLSIKFIHCFKVKNGKKTVLKVYSKLFKIKTLITMVFFGQVVGVFWILFIPKGKQTFCLFVCFIN